jgi:hypothetical protein
VAVTINDLYRLFYSPKIGPLLLVLISVLAVIFTWTGRQTKVPRSGGRRETNVQRQLKDPFLLAMILMAGFATWFFWPIAERWTFSFWAIPALAISLPAVSREQVVCRLCGFSWSINDFCRGWLITGDTGSGKTFALRRLMHEVFRNTKNRPWGGLVIDEKGDEVTALMEIATHYGRAGDVRLLDPPG